MKCSSAKVQEECDDTGHDSMHHDRMQDDTSGEQDTVAKPSGTSIVGDTSEKVMEFDVTIDPQHSCTSGSKQPIAEDEQSASEDDAALQYRKRVKRKKAVKELWKKNTRKRMRNSGQSYVGVTGKTVPGRQIRQHCTKCRYNCTDSFDDSDIHEIFSSFWQTDPNCIYH